jgi:ubiquinone/menaquinone biosynthesis C-methylase UbiE
MDYIQKNKRAWEEAFNNRYAEWGADIVETIKVKDYAYFNNDTAKVLRTYSFKDKAIAQFCCNNGRELLSLAYSQKAKECIGFDIAENQVKFANEKAIELGVSCQFVAANILDIDSKYNNLFDYAIITIGALCWFKDLDAYFNIVSRCLRKNAILIINEQHPVCNMFGLPDDENYDEGCSTKPVNSYFKKEWRNTDGMYYMTKKEYTSEEFIDYSHPLSEIVNALVKNKLSIKSFNEYDYDISDSFEHLNGLGIPLSYILVAEKNS